MATRDRKALPPLDDWRMAIDRHFIARLCDPQQLSLEEAVRRARTIMRADSSLEMELVRGLRGGTDRQPLLEGACAERAVEILDAISTNGYVMALLCHLVRHPNPRLRSKAARFVAGRTASLFWLQAQFRSFDDRVRANLVEAMANLDAPGARELLQMALNDPHQRVVGNAVYRLYLDDPRAGSPRLWELAISRDAARRATAAWVMGATDDPAWRGPLEELAHDSVPGVRRSAMRSLVRLSQQAKSA